MPSRETMIIFARSVAANYRSVQAGGSFPSWETLKAIYDTAMEKPPDWNINGGANLTALKQGRWLRKDGTPGGTSDPNLGISWCGIFATYVLIGSGVPVKWRTAVGITPQQPYLEKLLGMGNQSKIIPGDICVKGSNQHHFIVYARNANTLSSYDGNLFLQKVGEDRHNATDVHTIFKPRF